MLTDSISFYTLALLAVITSVAGFLRGFVGFGANLINVPVLSLVVGPVPAVCISVLIGVPATLQLLPTAIRESETRIVVPMCAAIFLTTPAGVWVLVSADPQVMKMVISLLVLAMVALVGKGWRLKGHVNTSILIGAGTAGGLIQGAAGVGGPPVVAIALSRPGPARQQRGNVLALMTAISFASLAPFVYYGLITKQILIASAILLPFYAAFAWIGANYFSTGGQRLYRRAALATLTAVAGVTLLLAVQDFLSG